MAGGFKEVLNDKTSLIHGEAKAKLIINCDLNNWKMCRKLPASAGQVCTLSRVIKYISSVGGVRLKSSPVGKQLAVPGWDDRGHSTGDSENDWDLFWFSSHSSL